MTRPLLLGEAYSRPYEDGMVPLGGRIGRRLSEWAGGDIHALFDCRNLFPDYVDVWLWRAARDRWEQIRADAEWPLIVCLGRRVETAVTRGQRDYHAVREHDGIPVVTIPHPSGRNRLLNDPAQVERCRATLSAAASGRLPG